MSQRKIALRMGVSRSAVKAVLIKSLRPVPSLEKTKEGGIIYPSGKPQRCKICGLLVQMPCLACQLREIQRRFREGTKAGKETTGCRHDDD